MKDFRDAKFYKNICGDNYNNILSDLWEVLVKHKLNVQNSRLLLRSLSNDLDDFTIIKE